MRVGELSWAELLRNSFSLDRSSSSSWNESWVDGLSFEGGGLGGSSDCVQSKRLELGEGRRGGREGEERRGEEGREEVSDGGLLVGKKEQQLLGTNGRRRETKQVG